ncbi:MAG TPA: hypothetical protein VKV16_06630, partial [Solirubrobacteraceae bacterium]|nr:hypothetical protein [Solirubrobacteraceae bacterium]
MNAQAGESAEDRDWRLQAQLLGEQPGGVLRELVGRLRQPDVVKEVEARVPHDVVVTHDGAQLFAYAADQSTLSQARRAIEAALGERGAEADVRVSRWDEELDRWLQVDPPPSADARRERERERRDAQTIETRTLVASSGKLVRGEFEQTMRAWAQRLGIDCAIVEHPHLLSTQVAFTVTGPRGKLQEFARGLSKEE